MGVAPLLWLNIIDPAVQNALTVTQVASLSDQHIRWSGGVPAAGRARRPSLHRITVAVGQ